MVRVSEYDRIYRRDLQSHRRHERLTERSASECLDGQPPGHRRADYNDSKRTTPDPVRSQAHVLARIRSDRQPYFSGRPVWCKLLPVASREAKMGLEKRSIAIVGAGIGGLAVAATLQRAGMRADVYEQAAGFARVGAG